MALQRIDFRALIQLKATRERLTPQQYKTLRGQVLAGNPDGALKGLRKILARESLRNTGRHTAKKCARYGGAIRDKSEFVCFDCPSRGECNG